MLCRILTTLYGRDTRPVLIGAIVINVLLAMAVVLNAVGCVDFTLPHALEQDSTMFICLSVGTALVGWLAPVPENGNRQMFKSFTYMASSVIQVILANGFVTDSPPLSLMLLVSSALALWFFGAAVYVLKCEGLDGNYTKRRRV